MILLDGKKISQKRLSILTNEVDQYFLNAKTTRKPQLSVILVGDDASSEIYVRNKAKAAKKVGIESTIARLDKSTTAKELTTLITKLNQDPKVDGILLQLPLPKHLDEKMFIQMIDPEKDVDGFHFLNQGKLMENLMTIYPCTPLGIINLLENYHLKLENLRVSVVGTSNIVGKPVGLMLINKGATVSFLNKNTLDLKSYTKDSDLIISATGQPNLITKDMVKKGVIIVDVGIYRDPKTGKLLGDVDPEVAKKASYFTPVPGGVGPMTIASLLENT
jgi:methylenetetrahydrofolate dehydrogenase (NADP+)/methenyltetrahydrofolate cyclohydrolase